MRPFVSYRAPLRRDLLSGDARCEGIGLEIVADHLFASPLLVDALAERYPLALHDTGCSLGSGPPSAARLARLREIVARARPILFTDHLALTRSAQIDLGHLCPIDYSRARLSRVIDGVRCLQDTLEVPVALENIASPFSLPAEMREGEFWHRLVEATGCGMLLDLTNLLLDARNAAAHPSEVEALCARRLSALPLSAVCAVHLAGGNAEGNWWIDSHSAPVEDATYALLSRLAGWAPLSAVIVERDAHLPDVFTLIAEASRGVAAFARREE